MFSRLILLCAVFASAAASADVDPPAGIKIGDGRLHPYFDLEARYDSAVAYRPTGELEGDIDFRFRPGLLFELLTTDTLVRFNGNAEYVLYPGFFDSVTKDASRFQTDIGVEAAFNKTGAVEFQIGDQLVRSDRTQNAALTIGAISLYNNVHLAVPIHPGGGALEFTPKAAFAVEFFSPLIGNGAGLEQMNYGNITGGLSARWKFLPKTAVVFDSSFDYRLYWNTTGAPAALMKLQAGLAGLISSKISLLILAGYGRDFIRTNAASTFIGQAEVGIILSDLISFNGGVVRTIQPVPLYGTYDDTRGYLGAKLSISRFSLNVSGAYDFLTFNPFLLNANGAQRVDQVVTVGVTPSIRILSWFSIAATYNLSYRSSNVPSTAGQPSPSFVRHEAILLLHFSY